MEFEKSLSKPLRMMPSRCCVQCQQIWKTQQWPHDWKKSILILHPKKGSTKEYSNHQTIVLISHASTEKAIAPHSNTLAWKIPWAEEPGRLQFRGSRRVGHDWATSLSLFTFMHWRRKWQPTPVFLPGESHGQRSLVGCRLWGRTESDTTEATQQQQQQPILVRSCLKSCMLGFSIMWTKNF